MTMSFAGYQDLSGTTFAISPRPFSVKLAHLTWIPILAFLIIALIIPGVFSFLYLIVNFCFIWQWMNKFHWHKLQFQWTLYIVASGIILTAKLSFQLALYYHGDFIFSRNILELLGVECPTDNSTGDLCPLKKFRNDIYMILCDVIVFVFLLVVRLCYYCSSRRHTLPLDQYCQRWYNRRDAFVETASQLVRRHREAADRRERELEKQGEDLMACNKEELVKYFREIPLSDEENGEQQLQIQDGNVQEGEGQTGIFHLLLHSLCPSVHNNDEQEPDERDPLLNHGEKSVRQGLLLMMSQWADLYHLVAKRCELEDVTQIDELRRKIEEEIMNKSRTWKDFWGMFWQVSLHLLAFIWPFVVFSVMILHTVLEGHVLSLIYPILIFCRGLLTVPRPSVRFWKVVTLFTMFAMIVKHICRLSFLPWNTEGPLATWIPYYYDPPQFIGLERSSTYGVIHLLILVFLLIQCYFLRRYGMWPREQQQQQRRAEDVEDYEQ